MDHLKAHNNMSGTEILIQSIVCFNRNIDKSIENNEICKCVKRLLSCLQSISKRHSISSEKALLLSKDQSFRRQLSDCLSKLEDIVFNEITFAETSVLSGLAIALTLNIYFCDSEKAIHLYFKLFAKQSIVCIVFNEYKTENNLNDVLDSSHTNSGLTKVSLLSGLLNCSYFIDYLIRFEAKNFIKIHCHIIEICSQRLIHEFHVFRLLQHWFRTFNNYIKQIAEKEPNLLDDKSLITNSLDQIDNNWEHPINGVKDCIKIIYNSILEVFMTFKEINAKICSIDSFDLIHEEVVKSSRMSMTCKAKYRKLSALIQFVGWEPVLQLDPNLSSQMLKYLSINSLSSAIIELYKSIIISMKNNTNEDILKTWSQHWLTHICLALKSDNKVIHNNMIAHVLPFTLINIDNSTQLIFENISDSSVAEVALVRASIDNNLVLNFLPPFIWFKKILIHNDDSVREEGLSLLIDGRYISDRNKVFKLFKLFLLSNLNVDNPSFRQTIVSKIDHFLTKLCISLSDKFGLHSTYDEFDIKTIEFLNEYTRIITSNLISSASYQRRTTCLLLLNSLIAIKEKTNLRFDEILDLNSIYFLIVLSIIDKDDRVRKMASNLLIVFHNTYFNAINYSLETIAEIGVNFINSPRHQESHSGGLLFKYIINCFKAFKINGKHLSNELEVIEFFVKSAQIQYNSCQQNLLNSAKNLPIHGFVLALNNCLTYDCLEKFSAENRFKALINDSIMLCLDCINLMLNQLSHSNIESSPSFQEICESLETIIYEQMGGNEKQSFDDISTSNEFQLLLSMSWLNIKECSFLLSNSVELSQQFEQQIISVSVVHKIGSQLINILTKCRHKGVIEATCIALTRYTISLIKLKTQNNEHIETLKLLLTDSLNCITKSALTSSITRRSAGVALAVQAILVGESEAYYQGFKLDVSLFDQTIGRLISIANLDLPKIIDPTSDLPQTYALHILKSIISTASLSRFTVKTVEFLLPICIKNFSSNVWQIRNASLQLFGSCCCRMLGQRKTSSIEHSMTVGSTITSQEFFSRYTTLLSVFKVQFEENFKRMDEGFMCSELVPLLSLFASFSPICFGDAYNDRQVLNYLIRLLSNKIWKIRMLSAKALSCLLPIVQLEELLFQLCEQQNLDCNSIHGLILTVSHLIELKQQNNKSDYQTIKDRFAVIFEAFFTANAKCYILNRVYQEIFANSSIEMDSCTQQLDNKQMNETIELKQDFNEFLDEIYTKVEFNKSEDIRLFGANVLNNRMSELIEYFESTHSSDIIFKIIEILLVILEDEDRTVRSEAENIVQKLFKNSYIMSFNVAIDNLFIWLIENPLINEQKLTDFLVSKLESVISLSQLFELQLNNEILFEKEEKNVFSEPLFQLFKTSESIKKVMSRKLTTINDKSLRQLTNDCRYCLQHKSKLELKSIVAFSIWKLPKLFVCLSSLYLRLDIFFHYICINSNETEISSIINSINELHFSFDNFEKCFVEQKNQIKGILTEEELVIMSHTFKLLSTKFPFLSHIRQNTLSGALIIEFFKV